MKKFYNYQKLVKTEKIKVIFDESIQYYGIRRKNKYYYRFYPCNKPKLKIKDFLALRVIKDNGERVKIFLKKLLTLLNL